MQIFSANGAKLLELLIFYYFLTYMCALGARARVARNFPTRRLFFQIFLLNFFSIIFWKNIRKFFTIFWKNIQKLVQKSKFFSSVVPPSVIPPCSRWRVVRVTCGRCWWQMSRWRWQVVCRRCVYLYPTSFIFSLMFNFNFIGKSFYLRVCV